METAEHNRDEIFQRIRKKCQEDGFIHALAEMNIEDTFIHSKTVKELSADHFIKINNDESLIRYELTLLTGCMVQAPIVQKMPDRAQGC